MKYGMITGICTSALIMGCVQIKAPDKPIEINLNVKLIRKSGSALIKRSKT